jgi:hypothetical protein
MIAHLKHLYEFGGKYNEGQLVGEVVKFPTTAEEMQEVFKRIGINAEYEKSLSRT